MGDATSQRAQHQSEVKDFAQGHVNMWIAGECIELLIYDICQ